MRGPGVVGAGDQGGLEDGVLVPEGLDSGAYYLQDPGQQQQQGALCPLLLLTGDVEDRKLLLLRLFLGLKLNGKLLPDVLLFLHLLLGLAFGGKLLPLVLLLLLLLGGKIGELGGDLLLYVRLVLYFLADPLGNLGLGLGGNFLPLGALPSLLLLLRFDLGGKSLLIDTLLALLLKYLLTALAAAASSPPSWPRSPRRTSPSC